MIKLNEDEGIQVTYFITEQPTAITLVISSLEDTDQAEAILEQITTLIEQNNATTH